MKDSPGALELLSERVDELERRVRALEHPAEVAIGAPRAEPRPVEILGQDSLLETGSIFAVVGRALLGIAGAYVLRAIAEAGVLPKLPVSIGAAVYAFGWLVWSARAESRLARMVYAATSALILAPMLWENTLGFHVFTPMSTAGVLAAFMTLATVLDSRNGETRGTWIAQAVAVLTTAALGFTTLDGLPFVTALLVAVFVSEFARSREVEQPVWPLIVLVTDAAVWGLIFIYSGPQETRALYPVLSTGALIAPACVLFAMNGVSVATRVVGRGCRIAVLEVAQVVIAFGLTAAALLVFAPARGQLILGAVCLILSAGSYTCGFLLLKGREERRSFRVFTVWSVVLLVAGAGWAFPREGAAALLGVAAVVAIYLAGRIDSLTLEVHGAVFLLCGGVLAGLPRFVYEAVAGPVEGLPRAGIVLVLLCAAAAVVLAVTSAEAVWRRLAQTAIALVAVCGVTALLAVGAVGTAGALVVLEAHHVAFLRTLIACGVALAIAFGASRWGRPALTHLAYVALVVVGVKIFVEDLRMGHMGFVAASIAMFAVTLMSVPRLVRRGAQRCAEMAMKREHTQEPHVQV